MKYKLIKEYPGSEKLGSIFDDPGCADYPEFYEKLQSFKIGDLVSTGNFGLGIIREGINNNVILKATLDTVCELDKDKFKWAVEIHDSTYCYYCLKNNRKKTLRLFKESELTLIEKNWEITAFRRKDDPTKIIVKQDNGNFVPEEKTLMGLPGASKEYLLQNINEFEIYSIKRLFDGQEFKIGDFLNNYYQIRSFRICNSNNNLLEIIHEYGYFRTDDSVFNDFKLLKKEKILTTEDGVDLYKGDNYWLIFMPLCTLNSTGPNSLLSTIRVDSSKHKLFSTLKAAQEYIIENKPILSLKDVKSLLPNSAIQDYTKLIKTRLNIK